MNKQIKYIFLSAVRATVKFFCFFAIFNIVNLLFKRFTEKFNEENISEWSLAIMLFVALSVTWAFYNYNKRAKKHFTESCNLSDNSGKTKSFVRVFISSDFLTDTVVCLILSCVSSFAFDYSDIQTLLFGNAGLNQDIKKLLVGIFIGLIFLLVNWFTIYDIRRRWLRNKDLPSKNEILIIFAYLCLITLIYTIGFYIAMAYVPGLYTYVYIIRKYFWQIISALIVIIAVSFLLINFKRFQKRKNFISKLKKVSVECEFELSDIKNPYLSVFKKTSGESFTVTAYGKDYKCKMISGKRKNISIIFSDKDFLLFKRTVHIGKKELFSIYSKQNYAFESDVKKCIIITCIPLHCYFKDSNGHMREIDTGEKIGEYTVFSANGFLGALERNCIDR